MTAGWVACAAILLLGCGREAPSLAQVAASSSSPPAVASQDASLASLDAAPEPSDAETPPVATPRLRIGDNGEDDAGHRFLHTETEGIPAVSPDGRQVAYSNDPLEILKGFQLTIRDVDAPSRERVLTITEVHDGPGVSVSGAGYAKVEERVRDANSRLAGWVPLTMVRRTNQDTDPHAQILSSGPYRVTLDLSREKLTIERVGARALRVDVPGWSRCRDPQTFPRQRGYDCPCQPFLAEVGIDHGRAIVLAEVQYIPRADFCNPEPHRFATVRLPAAAH
jgi:hypothetical protein